LASASAFAASDARQMAEFDPLRNLVPHRLLIVAIYNELQSSIGAARYAQNKRRNAVSPPFSWLT